VIGSSYIFIIIIIKLW